MTIKQLIKLAVYPLGVLVIVFGVVPYMLALMNTASTLWFLVGLSFLVLAAVLVSWLGVKFVVEVKKYV